MSEYIMVIDKKRCIGCHTCAIACKTENNLPKGIACNKVLTNKVPRRRKSDWPMDVPEGMHNTDGGFLNSPERKSMSLTYYTKACQHCEEPPCVKVCPVAATYKRESDGIVIINYSKCIGCNACIPVCPYSARVEIKETTGYHAGIGEKEADGLGAILISFIKYFAKQYFIHNI